MSNLSYLGIKTIIIFQIKNFLKEFQFNIIAPLINTLLFVLILSTINRYYSFNQNNYSYINFLVPGILIAGIFQTSFNHLSEVIISMKQVGSFSDFLISPISRIEIYISFIISSIVVSLIVALINYMALYYFINIDQVNYFSFFYYLLISIIIFSSFGAIIGLLSFTWDVSSSVSNFFIIPVSLLSGTFFSLDIVSEKLKFLFTYNPFYYLVNGFRGSFLSNYKISLTNDLYILLILFITLLVSIYIFNKGYKVIN